MKRFKLRKLKFLLYLIRKIVYFREVMDYEVRYCGISIKKLQDLANTYRKRYDPHYAKITPHMTLKDSFDASEEEIQTIVKQLDELAAKYAPLNIHASRISSFFPTTNAIYFRIEPTEQLAAFQHELQEKSLMGK